MTTQICANCDGVMEANLFHNCIRGITDNIENLRRAIAQGIEKRPDHLDGLKYALQLVENLEHHYQACGYHYKDQDKDPFHDIKNEIRMHLGLRLVSR